jgi:sterol desaturase/sphingolipid hydroxylase (fatty acid hydroxylase superfamily)
VHASRLRGCRPRLYHIGVPCVICTAGVFSIVGLFGAGLFTWTLLEYAIHGWMGHRFATFVTPIHHVHHRDPRAVFALGAWLPAMLPILVGVALGARGWTVFYAGILIGFAIYEVLHYRMHFSVPLCRAEARMRTHHLIHHYCAPELCFGVTTAMWDRVFQTSPSDAEAGALAARVASIVPLKGRSNVSAPGAVMRRLIATIAIR